MKIKQYYTKRFYPNRYGDSPIVCLNEYLRNTTGYNIYVFQISPPLGDDSIVVIFESDDVLDSDKLEELQLTEKYYGF